MFTSSIGESETTSKFKRNVEKLYNTINHKNLTEKEVAYASVGYKAGFTDGMEFIEEFKQRLENLSLGYI